MLNKCDSFLYCINLKESIIINHALMIDDSKRILSGGTDSLSAKLRAAKWLLRREPASCANRILIRTELIKF